MSVNCANEQFKIDRLFVGALCYKPEVAGSSLDEVDFPVDLSLTAALWSWSRLSL
jgi:hypothetical protein